MSEEGPELLYEIECIATNSGWMYRVTLLWGQNEYVGKKFYKRFGDAERAAKAVAEKERK
jgi:hypothetical protein